MAEKSIELDSVEIAAAVFGNCDRNIRMLEKEFSVTAVCRGTMLRISGEPANVAAAARAVEGMLLLIESKKNQKVVEVKETRLSLNIDTNDFNTKLNQTAKFLAAGHKVKASIRFRGREMAHSALGADVLKRFAEALPQASMDKPPVLEGRTMSILLIPKPNKD